MAAPHTGSLKQLEDYLAKSYAFELFQHFSVTLKRHCYGCIFDRPSQVR